MHLEDIVLKVAFLLGAVREDHFAISVLNSTDPLALITATVCPIHLSVAISFIFFVLTLVDVSTGPLEHSIPVLSITQVVTFIAVTLRAAGAAPLPLAFFHSSLEVAHVARAIRPGVLTFSVGFTIDVLTCVGVAVHENVSACAMLQTPVPFAFIPVAVLPCVHAVAVGFTLMPFANVTVIE